MKKYITVEYGSIKDFIIKVKYQQGKHMDEIVDFKYVDASNVGNTVDEFVKLYKVEDIIDFTQEL